MSQSALEPFTRGSINRNTYHGIFIDLGNLNFGETGRIRFVSFRSGVYSVSSLRDLATGIFVKLIRRKFIFQIDSVPVQE